MVWLVIGYMPQGAAEVTACVIGGAFVVRGVWAVLRPNPITHVVRDHRYSARIFVRRPSRGNLLGEDPEEERASLHRRTITRRGVRVLGVVAILIGVGIIAEGFRVNACGPYCSSEGRWGGSTGLGMLGAWLAFMAYVGVTAFLSDRAKPTLRPDPMPRGPDARDPDEVRSGRPGVGPTVPPASASRGGRSAPP